MIKWHWRFILLAREVSTWSKDPSTKCGAVVASGKELTSCGFNGFPPGLDDTMERLDNRDLKYSMTLHADDNALFYAGEKSRGADLYTYPALPCSRCAVRAIRAGIKEVVSVYPPDEFEQRWGESIELGLKMLKEAGVTVTLYNMGEILHAQRS